MLCCGSGRWLYTNIGCNHTRTQASIEGVLRTEAWLEQKVDGHPLWHIHKFRGRPAGGPLPMQ